SGTAQTWDAMAIQIFNDLKSDLKLDTKTPAVIGQLRSDNTSPSQNNTNFNNMVNGIPAKYPNSAVASSQGLSGNGKDVWHFRPSSMRELGKRYARAVLSLTDHTFIPRKGDVTGVYNSSKSEIASTSDIFSTQKDIKIYSLSGKLIQQYASNKITGAKSLNSGHVYIVAPNSYSKTRLMVIP
ncbi:MAG TPA: sialate O-acetylesterase, partial [Chitinispirillaceae bacterium]|nr:sialate O-acetylesterase [Chitinispirillaceae bacterium]